MPWGAAMSKDATNNDLQELAGLIAKMRNSGGVWLAVAGLSGLGGVSSLLTMAQTVEQLEADVSKLEERLDKQAEARSEMNAEMTVLTGELRALREKIRDIRYAVDGRQRKD